MKRTLSIRLFDTLQQGCKQLDYGARERIARFVESQRTAADTFVNKSGQEDLYYTVFGWMLALVLGLEVESNKMAQYLDKQPVESLSLIDYAAFTRCSMLLALKRHGIPGVFWSHLNPHPVQRPLFGFSGIPHQDYHSPYTQFIWMSLMEDTGTRLDGLDETSLEPYRVVDGGYANLRNSRSATTNATVAALAIKGQLHGYQTPAAVTFLRGLQDESGGFRATPQSPVPDLLSTATALFMLKNYHTSPAVAPEDFLTAHWTPSGGFTATLLEDNPDVEYTFYGLLALGTL